ncbi:MAG: glycosyltransferase family 39 protein [Verrucomicrobiota bacterium]
MNSGKIVIAGLILLTLGRFWLATQLEITPDEALLWQKSHRPDFTYTEPDRAGCAMARFGDRLFGRKPIALRYLNPLLAFSSNLLLLLVVRRTLTPAVAFWSIVLINLTPAFNQLAILHFGKGALFFFTSLALFSFWCALHRKTGNLALWATTGALLSIALGFHPTLIALPSAFILFLILNRHRRGQWSRPGVYVMIAMVLIGFATGRALLPASDPAQQSLVRPIPLSFTEALHSLRPLLFLITPMILVGLAWIPVAFFQHRSLPWRDKLFILLPSLAFLVIGILPWPRHPMAPIQVGLLLLIPCLTAIWFETDIAVKRYRAFRLLTFATAAVIGLGSLNASILRDFRIPWPRPLSISQPGHFEETANLLAEAASHTSATTGQPVFLISTDPSLASAISFYLASGPWHHHPLTDSPAVHLPESPGFDHDYQRWPGYSQANLEFEGKAALFIQPYHEYQDRPPANITNAFETWSPAGVLGIQRRGRTVQSWILFHCSGYRGLPF